MNLGTELFLGWDVGAWNCDKNPRSKDAVCALRLQEGMYVAVAPPWRGNLRHDLMSFSGRDLAAQLVRRAGAHLIDGLHVTIAIDAPLGWPDAMSGLIRSGRTIDVPAGDQHNPYLFRGQERRLFSSVTKPLSAVRDMIGSQSTKGIHFLHRAELQTSGVGTWEGDGVLAIETYPAVAARIDPTLGEQAANLAEEAMSADNEGTGEPWFRDVRDAFICALVAARHRQARDRLYAPDEQASVSEGWIWLPNGTGVQTPGSEK